MHRMHNEPKSAGGPETTGLTLHWASEYDIFSTVFGMGAKGSNSRMVIELAKIQPGDRVLDVCCGTGALTLAAKTVAGATGEVHGIDAAPEMIEVARKKARRSALDVIFDVGLIEKLSFPNDTFDVVISRLAIHHLPGDLKRQGFAEIFRVLKPGGHVLIADFYNSSTNPVVNHVMSALVGPRMMENKVWDIVPLLSAAGFVEVDSGPTRSMFLAFAGGKKPAK